MWIPPAFAFMSITEPFRAWTGAVPGSSPGVGFVSMVGEGALFVV
jgi:hypothetical protein